MSKLLNIYFNNNRIVSLSIEGNSFPIIYNGSTIATLSNSSIRLKCSGKIMRSDIQIGDIKLKCANKYMPANITMELLNDDIYAISKENKNLYIALIPGYSGNYNIYNNDVLVGYYDSNFVYHKV